MRWKAKPDHHAHTRRTQNRPSPDPRLRRSEGLPAFLSGWGERDRQHAINTRSHGLAEGRLDFPVSFLGEHEGRKVPFPIDSHAGNDHIELMGTTLVIRNLDEAVKQKLRLRASSHQRSMEAEVREILAASLAGDPPPQGGVDDAKAERRKRIEGAVGIWKDKMEGKTTDQLMLELRGDD